MVTQGVHGTPIPWYVEARPCRCRRGCGPTRVEPECQSGHGVRCTPERGHDGERSLNETLVWPLLQICRRCQSRE